VIDGDRVVHEVHYSHPVDVVWHALTTAAALAAWLMPNDFEPTVGHHFRFDARPGFGFIEGEVIDVQPPHLLQYRWTVEGAATIVTIRLEAADRGTRLRLEQVGLPIDLRPGNDGGWDSKLHDDLVSVLNGSRDPDRSYVVDQSFYRHPDLEPPHERC
jgi:uncharacterized protein YndB with AHSA1/START domain